MEGGNRLAHSRSDTQHTHSPRVPTFQLRCCAALLVSDARALCWPGLGSASWLGHPRQPGGRATHTLTHSHTHPPPPTTQHTPNKACRHFFVKRSSAQISTASSATHPPLPLRSVCVCVCVCVCDLGRAGKGGSAENEGMDGWGLGGQSGNTEKGQAGCNARSSRRNSPTHPISRQHPGYLRRGSVYKCLGRLPLSGTPYIHITPPPFPRRHTSCCRGKPSGCLLT